MKALFDAIFVKYAASTLSNFLTALYNTEADDRAEFPYAVLQVVNGKTDEFASGEHYTEDWLIQFNLFDKSADMSALLEAYAALTTAFDSCMLVIAGQTFLSCRREGTLQTRVEDVWQINVTYRVKVRRS